MNNYINIHCIIENFQFLSTHLILCILVTYTISWFDSSILLQIEVFKYIIRLHSVVIYPNLELCKSN